jgi:limonene-1,2-epoxide hydrolase
MSEQETNIAVVRRLCENWPWLSRNDFRELMAPDCDYRNIPVAGDKHVGPDEAHALLSRMQEAWNIDLEVLSIAAGGASVLTERIERFRHKAGKRDDCDLPVMGAFELKDGKITAWRDYFEMSHAKALMGG